jgi:hypothetical protein
LLGGLEHDLDRRLVDGGGRNRRTRQRDNGRQYQEVQRQ